MNTVYGNFNKIIAKTRIMAMINANIEKDNAKKYA